MIDVKLGVDDIPWPRSLRDAARIGRGTAVMELVAAPLRQGKNRLPFANAGQLSGEIAQLMSDKMDHFSFSLDRPIDAHHAGAEHDPAKSLKDLHPHD